MPNILRLTLPPFRIALALFALYAVVTVPTLLPRWGASPAGLLLLAAWIALAAIAWPIARGRMAARPSWIAVVMAGIALRLVAFVLIDGRQPVGDPMIYPMLARSLLAGEGLVYADPMSRTVFRALYPPGYPLLLAGWGALFGTGAAAIWASNVAVDLGIAALLGRLGARLGRPAAGRAAAWLFATWPTFVLAAPFAQKEPVQTLLVLAIMLVLLRARSGWREAAMLGAAAGALALVQPGLATLPAVLVVAIAPVAGVRRMAWLAVRAVPFAVIVMLPWWVRNAMLLGHFVPLTSTGGLGLWIGNNPGSSGNWMPLPPAYDGMDEVAMSARGAAEARAWIVAHPWDFVRLSATKLVRTMGVEQFTVLRLSLVEPAVRPALLAALFPLLQGSLAIVLGGAALLAGRVRRAAGGEVVLVLAIACLAQLILFDLWFEFGERHRYMLMPVLFLVLGCASATLPGARGRRRAPAAAEAITAGRP